MLKVCAACEHPEKNALEDALVRGEPYQTLKTQFRVSIGSMRRHRKGHMTEGWAITEDDDKPGEEVYLRFRELPEGGQSYNAVVAYRVGGVSAFRGYKTASGYYVFDIPREEEFMNLLSHLVHFLITGHALYLATGREVEEEGPASEPLLEEVTLKLIPRSGRIQLPAWLEPKGKKLADGWNRWWRNGGHLESKGHPKRRGSWKLEEDGAQVLAKAGSMFGFGASRYEVSTPSQMHARNLEGARETLRDWKRQVWQDNP